MRICILLFILICSGVQAQEDLGDIALSFSGVDDLDTFVCGDSIFLSFSEKTPGEVKNKRCFWILPDGKIQSVKIPELTKKIICGVNKSGTRIYYYEVSKKKASVKCISYDPASGQSQTLPGEILLPGKIIGSYFDEDLTLIWVTKESFKLEIVTIRDMHVLQSRSFPFSADLASGRQTVAFITNERNIRPEVAAADIKVIKRPGEIIVISDEHNRAGDHDGQTNRTLVSKIDLITEKIVTRTWSEPYVKFFNTTMYADYVVRSIPSKGLKVHDFSTNKLVNEFSYDQKYTGISYYARDGTTKTVTHQVAKKYRIAGGVVMIDPAENGNVVWTIGRYWLDKPPMLAGPSSLAALSLFLSVTTGLNRALTEGTSMSDYTYFKAPITSQPEQSVDISLTRKLIDDYEIQQQEKGIRFKFKAYSVAGETTYCFYREKESDKLKVVKFRPPETQ